MAGLDFFSLIFLVQAGKGFIMALIIKGLVPAKFCSLT